MQKLFFITNKTPGKGHLAGNTAMNSPAHVFIGLTFRYCIEGWQGFLLFVGRRRARVADDVIGDVAGDVIGDVAGDVEGI